MFSTPSLTFLYRFSCESIRTHAIYSPRLICSILNHLPIWWISYTTRWTQIHHDFPVKHFHFVEGWFLILSMRFQKNKKKVITRQNIVLLLSRYMKASYCFWAYLHTLPMSLKQRSSVENFGVIIVSPSPLWKVAKLNTMRRYVTKTNSSFVVFYGIPHKQLEHHFAYRDKNNHRHGSQYNSFDNLELV